MGLFYNVLLFAAISCCCALTLTPPPVNKGPLCLPQVVVSSSVVAIVRGGRFCSDTAFMNSLEKEISSNLTKCTLMDIALSSCREKARTLAIFSINITCSDACVRHVDDRRSLAADRHHRVELLELVRSKPKLSTELRALTVTLAYFRGKKTYHRLCPGGVAGNLRNKIDLCACEANCNFINCTGDLVYEPCGYYCGETCQNIANPPLCFPFCSEGCFCPGGQIPVAEGSDQCSPRAECCPGDTELTRCGSACPRICGQEEPTFCTQQCVQGCFCPGILARLGDRCVPSNRCPSANNTCMLPPDVGSGRASISRYFYNSSSQRCEEMTYAGCGGNGNRFDTRDSCLQRCSDPRCRGDMVYSECGAFCGVTCENHFLPPNQQPVCDETCLQGCFCPSGLIPLSSNSSECVLPQECPTPQCPGDKVFTTCGSACPRTCSNLGNDSACILLCVPGCFCPDGLIEMGDRCVPPTQCPNDTCLLPPETGRCKADFPRYFHNSTSQKCEKFVYGGCGGNGNRFETKDSCQQRCSDPRCRGDMVYSECGAFCGVTCENHFLPPSQQPVCVASCQQGCFCPSGLIPLSSNSSECVLPQECPTPQCPADKVFTTCGSACPSTCANKDQLIACTQQCVQGCFCPRGLVELGVRCVAPTQCPNGTCLLPAAAGPCRAFFPRYYYNVTTDRCERFIYGGCCANDNNFKTAAECRQNCSSPAPAPPLRTLPQCPGDKVFRRCGCPRNCSNLNCTSRCEAGCFCPDGLIEMGDSCVPPTQCPNDTCLLPPETGRCKAAIRRYFYNSTSQKCERFIYGGCGGNGNNFETKKSCRQRCSDPRCRGDMVYSECGAFCGVTCENHFLPPSQQPVCIASCQQGCFCPSGLIPLSSNSSECVLPQECPTPQCPGDKVFTTCGSACPRTCANKDQLIACTLQCVQACQCPSGTVELGNRCVPPELCPVTWSDCLLPPDSGPCEALGILWFHNATSKKCEQFEYGGCLGNDNRFCSEEECSNLCQDPCDRIKCDAGYECKVFGNEAYCNPNCRDLNPCPKDKVCRITPIFCFRAPCPGTLSCVVISDSPIVNGSFSTTSVNCSGVVCPTPGSQECPPLLELETCCQQLMNCAAVLCLKPACPSPIPADPSTGRCCPTCPPINCAAVTCPAKVPCDNPIPPDLSIGRCCATCPTGPDPCRNKTCAAGYECLVYGPTGEGYCSPNCAKLNPCAKDEQCNITDVNCVRAPCPGVLSCKPIDPCTNVTCSSDEVCLMHKPTKTGYCNPICGPNSCSANETCEIVNVRCRPNQPCPQFRLCHST